jgi:transposase
MALGRRKKGHQELWVATTSLAQSPGHPFYEALNRLLAEAKFDEQVERWCEPHYAASGRPGLAPGVYFRMLLVGYFEGLDSQRGIAWRCSDSLSLQEFLGVGPGGKVPDHSTLTLTRQRLPLEVFERVFALVLTIAKEKDLLSGRLLGVDSTMVEANAAMRTIVRRDSGEDWKAYVKRLAAAEGVEIKDDDDLRRFDKNRKDKGVSNKDWTSASDPDAQITKMKDGRTHLAYKAEHAVDLESGLVLAATVHPATTPDGATLGESVLKAQQNVLAAGSEATIQAVVADKGYHKAEALAEVAAMPFAPTTYVSEPKRIVRRRWTDKPEAWKAAVQGNRRRWRGARSKALHRLRSERVERTFAHALETGRGRRSWIRGLAEVGKRYLVQIAGLNLGTILRNLIGMGTPRGLADRSAAFLALVAACMSALAQWTRAAWAPIRDLFRPGFVSAHPSALTAGHPAASCAA